MIATVLAKRQHKPNTHLFFDPNDDHRTASSTAAKKKKARVRAEICTIIEKPLVERFVLRLNLDITVAEHDIFDSKPEFFRGLSSLSELRGIASIQHYQSSDLIRVQLGPPILSNDSLLKLMVERLYSKGDQLAKDFGDSMIEFEAKSQKPKQTPKQIHRKIELKKYVEELNAKTNTGMMFVFKLSPLNGEAYVDSIYFTKTFCETFEFSAEDLCGKILAHGLPTMVTKENHMQKMMHLMKYIGNFYELPPKVKTASEMWAMDNTGKICSYIWEKTSALINDSKGNEYWIYQSSYKKVKEDPSQDMPAGPEPDKELFSVAKKVKKLDEDEVISEYYRDWFRPSVAKECKVESIDTHGSNPALDYMEDVEDN